MKSIAFHIQKGGQGKTTLTGNIAYSLFKKGKNVLMIDSDQSQGNLSTWLLREQPKYELGDLLLQNCTLEDSIISIRKNDKNKLDLIPTFGVDSQLKKFSIMSVMDPNSNYIFIEFLKLLENLKYDFVLFDLSPAMANLEKYILYAVDEIINPLSPEFFGLNGVQIFNAELEKITKTRNNIKDSKNIIHNKVIVNMVNRSFSTHKSALKEFDELKKVGFKIYTVGQNRKIADCLFNNEFLEEYDPQNKEIDSFKEIIKDL